MNTACSTAYNADMLEAIFTSNNWKETVIRTPDGVDVAVSPCYYGNGIPSRENVEYYLVYGDMPWMGCDSLEKLAKQLNEHANELAKLEAERAEIRAFFNEHQASGWNDDSWSWYSDWHKDLFGYRPHGYVCGTYVEPFKGACLVNDHSEYTKVTVVRAE